MSIVVNKTRLPVTEWQTESGSVVGIANARRRDAKSAVVTLEPIQDLHGYANPWVGGAGKNKLKPCVRTNTQNEVTFDEKSDGSISISGTATGSAWIRNSITGKADAFKIPAGNYFLSGNTVGNANKLNLYLVYREWGTSGSFTTTNYDQGSGRAVSFSTDVEAYVQVYASSGFSGNYVIYPQLELGSTATAFEPYENLCPISGHSAVTLNHAGVSQSDNPTSITVQLGQTVYGGAVDLVSGVGTVTHGCYTITGSERWNTNSGNPNRYYSVAYILRGIAKLPSDNWSSVPIQTSIGNFDDSYNSMQYKNGKMCIAADGRIGINADLYDLYGGTDVLKDVQICYELATPITFQLTPTQLAMLERYNTIWADEGDIAVTYARIHS